MPIVGQFGSLARAGSFLLPGGAFESIATVTLGSAAASMEFTSIPSTYQHLQIRFIGRTSRSADEDYMAVQFNGDTGTNYVIHLLYGDGAAAYGAAATGESKCGLGILSGNTATANAFGAGVTDILDYGSTSKNKVIRSMGHLDKNGGGQVRCYSGLWTSTSAITSIKLIPYTASVNFAANTTASLYGLRAP